MNRLAIVVENSRWPLQIVATHPNGTRFITPQAVKPETESDCSFGQYKALYLKHDGFWRLPYLELTQAAF